VSCSSSPQRASTSRIAILYSHEVQRLPYERIGVARLVGETLDSPSLRVPLVHLLLLLPVPVKNALR
jgi:hypothetical protein